MAGIVVPGTAPRNPYGTNDPRYAVYDEQQRKKTAQEDFDRTYIANKGNMGWSSGFPGPSMDAIARVKAMAGVGTGSGPRSSSGGGGGGSSSSADGASSEADLMRLSAQLQADAEKRREGTIHSFLPRDSSGSSEGQPLDNQAAREAIYARAKDQIGQQTRSAIDTLRNMYASTGNIGAVNKGTTQIVEGGMGELGEVTRDQAIEDLAALEERGRENRQLALARRGQDLGLAPSLYGLITARSLY